MDMTTITEDYVSFEMAKLLKEKGFDEPCCGSYSYRGGNVVVRASKLSNTDLCYHPDISGISAPTLQMTMKWLRNVHGVYYDIQLLLGDKAEKYGDLQLGVYQLSSSGAYKWECWLYADTYEELYEKYIKYCLENLIK